jgi:hypothetical protein
MTFLRLGPPPGLDLDRITGCDGRVDLARWCCNSCCSARRRRWLM